MPSLQGVLGFVLILSVSAQAACPCSEEALCRTIDSGPRKEVFAFHVTSKGDVYQQFDMSQVTTISIAGDLSNATLLSNVVCFAHRYGARATLLVDYPKNQLSNATARSEWVQAQLAKVASVFADGINFDIEGSSSDRNSLTQLTTELVNAFKSANPHSQISMDTSIYPSADNPGYDFVALAKVLDFLCTKHTRNRLTHPRLSVPMAYDMCWGAKVAKANSPLPGVKSGLEMYQNLGISMDKIVIGLPWYGYEFPCDSRALNATCDVSVPFGGGSWSLAFSDVLARMDDTTIVQMDSVSQSPYFDVISPVTHNRSRIFYDDETSLPLRYALANQMHLRGVGFWTADFLSYANGKRVQSMWNAVKTFNSH